MSENLPANKIYERVTNILYPFSGLDKLDSDIVANAARRGTKVHKICESIISGLGELGVDEEAFNYVESFKLWWKDQPVIAMEKRFYCDDLMVTGQVDLIIETDEGLTLIDFKTSSSPSKTWKAQASAYYYLAKKSGLNIQKIYFVHLSKKSKNPKLYEYPLDENFFLAVYRTWEHFYK